ncbi:MAG: hypothetical protein PVG49_19305, partial [Desulfobacteraceae bacterium]
FLAYPALLHDTFISIQGGYAMKGRWTVALMMLFVSMALVVTHGEKSCAGVLGISNIVFCSASPEGYMKYNEQPDATFAPGQVVWIYMNLDNVKTNTNADGSQEIWIKLYLKVKAPNGDVLMDQELYNEHKNFPEKFNMDEMFLRVNLNTVSGMPEGRYTVELGLKDELAKTQASSASTFILKQ